MKITLKKGAGFWRLNKYPYGVDFVRLKDETQAELISGPVKITRQIRFKLNDGTLGITNWKIIFHL